MGEETKAEEQKPLVIQVDMHCAGCAKKIQRYITKIKGVEGVAVDKENNQVTIKGTMKHQAICNVISEKTKRKVTVISPVSEVEAEPIPEAVKSQVDEIKTVELKVNMHCEACAEQLKQKILKLKGVRTAVTEFSSGKVVVTGTMDAGKLVEYVYRRTRKQAQIVPAPEPEPEPEKKEPEPPPAEEAKSEPPAEEAKPEPPAEEKKEEPAAEEKKEEPAAEEKKEEPPADEKKEEPPAEEKKEELKSKLEEMDLNEEENLKKMIYYYHPLYVFETIPPPQIFSDENPNACCIS